MTVELPRIDDCWNTIGVRGDRTCPRLVEAVHCRNCPVYADAGRTLFDRPPPDGYAAEWAERLAAPEPEPPGEAHPVLLFRVGDEWFLRLPTTPERGGGRERDRGRGRGRDQVVASRRDEERVDLASLPESVTLVRNGVAHTGLATPVQRTGWEALDRWFA